MLRAVLLVLLLLATHAVAQPQLWTVQTVAYPDYRQAQVTLGELEDLGFDAYTEFTMGPDNRQWVRVRVGCFTTRDGAESFEALLVGHVTAEAVVQPFTEGSTPRFCVHDDIGFVKPSSWSVQSQSAAEIIFRVSLGGHTGYLRNAAGGWRMLATPEGSGAAAETGLRFDQVTMSGQQVVRVHLPSGPRAVCRGRIIWQDGNSAVVERQDVVTACRLRAVP